MPKPDQIKPLGHSKHIYMGLYGHSSAGKTRLISTLPNSLIIRPPIEHTESVKAAAAGVEEWVVKDWNEMTGEVLDYLRHEGHKHDFVWLDSVSGWQDVGLDDVWADTIAARPHRKGGPIDKGEYNQNMVRLAQWVRAVVGCDLFNFGFTAWPEELEDEEGNTRLMPWIQGKNMSNRWVGYMKLVCFLERKETKDGMKRVLRWGESETYFTKDQFGLPESGRMIDPTMPKLMEAIAKTRPASKKTTSRKKRTTNTKKRSAK